MDWERWLTLNPRRFVEKLDKKLQRGLTNNDVIGLFNAMMVNVPDDAQRCATLSDHIRQFFRSKKILPQAVIFDELSARAYFSVGDHKKVFACLHDMLDASQSPATIAEVLGITEGALGEMDSLGGSIDHREPIRHFVGEAYHEVKHHGYADGEEAETAHNRVSGSGPRAAACLAGRHAGRTGQGADDAHPGQGPDARFQQGRH
jgi:hypothetical protein